MWNTTLTEEEVYFDLAKKLCIGDLDNSPEYKSAGVKPYTQETIIRYPEFKAGMRIRITKGTFKGEEGILEATLDPSCFKLKLSKSIGAIDYLNLPKDRLLGWIEEVPDTVNPYKAGMRVRIIEGAFKGGEGILEESRDPSCFLLDISKTIRGIGPIHLPKDRLFRLIEEIPDTEKSVSKQTQYDRYWISLRTAYPEKGVKVIVRDGNDDVFYDTWDGKKWEERAGCRGKNLPIQWIPNPAMGYHTRALSWISILEHQPPIDHMVEVMLSNGDMRRDYRIADDVYDDVFRVNGRSVLFWRPNSWGMDDHNTILKEVLLKKEQRDYERNTN